MKRLITSIIVCFVAIAALAQTDMMRISYEHHTKVYKDKSKERSISISLGQPVDKPGTDPTFLSDPSPYIFNKIIYLKIPVT